MEKKGQFSFLEILKKIGQFIQARVRKAMTQS